MRQRVIERTLREAVGRKLEVQRRSQKAEDAWNMDRLLRKATGSGTSQPQKEAMCVPNRKTIKEQPPKPFEIHFSLLCVPHIRGGPTGLHLSPAGFYTRFSSVLFKPVHLFWNGRV